VLLDEPTNHLDVENHPVAGRLPGERGCAPGGRRATTATFLDSVCTQIVATERAFARTYLGNYSQHLEQNSWKREASQFGLLTGSRRAGQASRPTCTDPGPVATRSTQDQEPRRKML